jgi:hypothetical protein
VGDTVVAGCFEVFSNLAKKIMRDHLAILADIERYLAAKGMTKELEEVQFEVRAAATGSELCLSVGTWLHTFYVYSFPLDAEMESLYTEFIEYCHFNGLHPR